MISHIGKQNTGLKTYLSVLSRSQGRVDRVPRGQMAQGFQEGAQGVAVMEGFLD